MGDIMDNINELYNENKLLVRAMDSPLLKKNSDDLVYDTSTWANEFDYLLNDGLSSVSTTLIVPGVGVSTYKNIGFLINSDNADCFHIAKTDSGSRGNISNGDFFANEADFNTVDELASYIKENNATDLNEININADISSVVGLFINKCSRVDELLQRIYVIKKCLKEITEIDYPIYLYDSNNGTLEKIELTYQEEQEIIDNLQTADIYYWPDSYNEPVISNINNSYIK